MNIDQWIEEKEVLMHRGGDLSAWERAVPSPDLRELLKDYVLVPNTLLQNIKEYIALSPMPENVCLMNKQEDIYRAVDALCKENAE